MRSLAETTRWLRHSKWLRQSKYAVAGDIIVGDSRADVVHSLVETPRWLRHSKRLRQSKYLVAGGISVIVGVDDVEVGTGSTAVNYGCRL